MAKLPTRQRTAAAPDPKIAALVRNAAVGDVASQRALVENAFENARTGQTSFSHSVYVAECFARLAASHGGQNDRYVLACVLFYLADMHASDDADLFGYLGEALAILEDLADEGFEEAALMIQMSGDGLPIDVWKLLPNAARVMRAAGQEAEA